MPRLLDVIEYRDESGAEIVHRIPEGGPADIRMGAQLVVRETQAAVFFRDGKALDLFPPGRHTLSTGNLPILDSIIKFVSRGDTPFQAEVYFINQKVFTDQKWGTPHPINLRDSEFGIVPVRAFGSYSYRVGDPQLLIGTLVGTQGLVTTESLAGFLRTSIITHFNNLLSHNFKGILDAYQDVDAVSAGMKAAIKDDFGKYGLEVRDFFVQEITVPDNIQAALDQKSQMGILGTNYSQMRTFDVMQSAAENPGGAGGQAFSMGAGLQMGAMLPQMMQQNGGPQAAPPHPAAAPAPAPAPAAAAGLVCSKCQAAIPANGKFCMECGTPVQTKPICANCHQELPAGAKFCLGCGTKVG
ncbi:MAG TPA: SPFH domain-containing protein [Candidatus Xenobia bacterium]|jgi:membrane protease subunit (stomatin/prohibitin family)